MHLGKRRTHVSEFEDCRLDTLRRHGLDTSREKMYTPNLSEHDPGRGTENPEGLVEMVIFMSWKFIYVGVAQYRRFMIKPPKSRF